ncbi:hypothetical protein Snoj_10210 [Streptomyces nojiriensis]|uniref:Uncharacterized protein n=1 Tax=Streptomyces nojiriensis TaxID=66374 RepID=A0ABQ3SG32_9ACTN|nr:hypothetical protein [Streptomyces nojiriensis]QTI48743.1 hypothetical protein JYK04_06608 [Streptomyces nojiriensis]GGS27615.1 hypothetical protein GCM10010205_67070 [Streptomyces nojiriensis]GHI67103.1 hypothetical protein Snoj_10210 [Streptomyces nojiriensis]
MPRSEDVRTTGPEARPGLRPRAYRRAGAWLAMALGVWAAVAGATLPNGLVLAAGLVVAALAVNRLGAEPRTPRRPKPVAPP